MNDFVTFLLILFNFFLSFSTRAIIDAVLWIFELLTSFWQIILLSRGTKRVCSLGVNNDGGIYESNLNTSSGSFPKKDEESYFIIYWCAITMLIKEYRIALPLTVEEYRIAQLYMIAVSYRHSAYWREASIIFCGTIFFWMLFSVKSMLVSSR